jgi:hypothetical protein
VFPPWQFKTSILTFYLALSVWQSLVQVQGHSTRERERDREREREREREKEEGRRKKEEGRRGVGGG